MAKFYEPLTPTVRYHKKYFPTMVDSLLVSKKDQFIWTESEFHRVILNGRKLAPRTEAACRQVLVDGMSSRDAASAQNLLQTSVSRTVTVLRDRKNELDQSAAGVLEGRTMFKYIVTEIAKGLAGPGLFVEEAQLDKTYEGPVIVSQHGFLIQKVGRSGVMHELGNLDMVPPLNQPLSIAYSLDQHKAVVGDVAHSAKKGKDLSR